MTHCLIVSGNGCAKLYVGANNFLCFGFSKCKQRRNVPPLWRKAFVRTGGKRRMTALRTTTDDPKLLADIEILKRTLSFQVAGRTLIGDDFDDLLQKLTGAAE